MLKADINIPIFIMSCSAWIAEKFCSFWLKLGWHYCNRQHCPKYIAEGKKTPLLTDSPVSLAAAAHSLAPTFWKTFGVPQNHNMVLVHWAQQHLLCGVSGSTTSFESLSPADYCWHGPDKFLFQGKSKPCPFGRHKRERFIYFHSPRKIHIAFLLQTAKFSFVWSIGSIRPILTTVSRNESSTSFKVHWFHHGNKVKQFPSLTMSPRVSKVGRQTWHVSTVLLQTADNTFCCFWHFQVID